MYFIIYEITDKNEKVKYGLLDYIDISNVELYDLKKKITEIESKFEDIKNKEGKNFELFISNENVN